MIDTHDFKSRPQTYIDIVRTHLANNQSGDALELWQLAFATMQETDPALHDAMVIEGGDAIIHDGIAQNHIHIAQEVWSIQSTTLSATKDSAVVEHLAESGLTILNAYIADDETDKAIGMWRHVEAEMRFRYGVGTKKILVEGGDALIHYFLEHDEPNKARMLRDRQQTHLYKEQSLDAAHMLHMANVFSDYYLNHQDIRGICGEIADQEHQLDSFPDKEIIADAITIMEENKAMVSAVDGIDGVIGRFKKYVVPV